MSATTMASSVRLTMGPIPHGTHKSKEGARRRRVHVLLGVLALGLVGALGTILAKRGFPDIDPVKVHKAIDKAGYFGIALYILGFGVAELLHLPGMVFVVAGVLCWGHVYGWLLALIMAPLSCSISFLVIRRIGGQFLAEVQWSVVQKVMAKLDEHPVTTVAALRLCFFLAPAINYMLALSSVSFKDFVLGTLVGLVVPLTVAVFFIDHLITYMGWSKAQHVTIGHVGHALLSPPPPGMGDSYITAPVT